MDGTAKTPDVRLPPMSLTSDDLWSHPVGSPSYLGSCDCHVTQSRNRVSYRDQVTCHLLLGGPKVNQFYYSFGSHHHIGSLDVPGSCDSHMIS